jgi:uncharacterized membrane protein YkoI
MARAFTLLLLLTLLTVGLSVRPVRASDRDEVDRVRAAVQSGELLPLAQVLERLQRSHPGQVLEIELERDDGRWVYEVKLLQTGGRLLKLELDGRTAAVLKQRVKRQAAPASSPAPR